VFGPEAVAVNVALALWPGGTPSHPQLNAVPGSVGLFDRWQLGSRWLSVIPAGSCTPACSSLALCEPTFVTVMVYVVATPVSTGPGVLIVAMPLGELALTSAEAAGAPARAVTRSAAAASALRARRVLLEAWRSRVVTRSWVSGNIRFTPVGVLGSPRPDASIDAA
jgi:hypothetical protein